jgi:hypothetical protein
MMNELQNESFHRDLDISFEFPDDINTSNQKVSQFPTLGNIKSQQSMEDSWSPKPAFNRK